jgi:hypothetical protein
MRWKLKRVGETRETQYLLGEGGGGKASEDDVAENWRRKSPSGV